MSDLSSLLLPSQLHQNLLHQDEGSSWCSSGPVSWNHTETRHSHFSLFAFNHNISETVLVSTTVCVFCCRQNHVRVKSFSFHYKWSWQWILPDANSLWSVAKHWKLLFPVCSGCLVGIIFFILGLGTLLPWNFFMTASLVKTWLKDSWCDSGHQHKSTSLKW